jgi:phosphohistidine phosphatase SixA
VQGKGETDVDLSRCETQRNLSESGKAQATQIGRGARALGVPIGKVLVSPFCRCKDTAKLAFGHFEVVDDLQFALMAEASASERARLGAALRQMLATAPARATNTVIVAHTANLREAANIWPKPEGVAYIFRPLGNGQFEPIAMATPDEWTALALAARVKH